MSEHPLERFLPLLVSGDGTASEADLAPDIRIFDPQAGAVGPEVLPFFLPSRYMWLADRNARLEHVRTIRSTARAVVEQVLHLVIVGDEGKTLALPVALVGETNEDGKLNRIRIYHATHPLTGHHEPRGPLIPADETIVLSEPISTYQDALARGDVEGVLATFADEGEGRRATYETLLAAGGLVAQPCAVTDDGAACALELIVTARGDRMLVPQASLVLFERASPGMLRAVRIYDDLEPLPR